MCCAVMCIWQIVYVSSHVHFNCSCSVSKQCSHRCVYEVGSNNVAATEGSKYFELGCSPTNFVTQNTYFLIYCQNAVNSRIISGNLDSPEGGLEALLQAVVCQDVSCYIICTATVHPFIHMHTCTHVFSPLHPIPQIIGWRPNPARRLLVYMSDAGIHFGGDGKVG